MTRLCRVFSFLLAIKLFEAVSIECFVQSGCFLSLEMRLNAVSIGTIIGVCWSKIRVMFEFEVI